MQGGVPVRVRVGQGVSSRRKEVEAAGRAEMGLARGACSAKSIYTKKLINELMIIFQ